MMRCNLGNSECDFFYVFLISFYFLSYWFLHNPKLVQGNYLQRRLRFLPERMNREGMSLYFISVIKIENI